MLDAIRVSHLFAGFPELRTQQRGCDLAEIVRSDVSCTAKDGAQNDDADDSNFHRSASITIGSKPHHVTGFIVRWC
jgi:hypothetical protein